LDKSKQSQTDLIRVHAVYQFFKKQEKKFDRIDVTIGDKTTECPIAYIRVSELSKLEEMLKEAYQLGYEKAEAAYKTEEMG
jgi:hypothetical protein